MTCRTNVITGKAWTPSRVTGTATWLCTGHRTSFLSSRFADSSGSFTTAVTRISEVKIGNWFQTFTEGMPILQLLVEKEEKTLWPLQRYEIANLLFKNNYIWNPVTTWTRLLIIRQSTKRAWLTHLRNPIYTGHNLPAPRHCSLTWLGRWGTTKRATNHLQSPFFKLKI